MDKLIAGFSTSEIRVWGIGDTVLMNPKLRTCSIKLACDLPTTSRSSNYENNIATTHDDDDDDATATDSNDNNNETEESGAIILRGHTDIIHDMKFIADSEVLISVSSDKDMRAWRLNDYSCAAIYK